MVESAARSIDLFKSIFASIWPVLLWQKLLFIGAAFALAGVVLWVFGKRQPLPKLNLTRYKFAHEPYATIAGLGTTFTERGTLASITGLTLRTYLTLPVHRVGNGRAITSSGGGGGSGGSGGSGSSSGGNPTPKGLFVFLPSIHAHMNYYGIVSEHLKGLGFAVAGMDYSGHGESEGARGLVSSHESIVKDVIAYINTLVAPPPATAATTTPTAAAAASASADDETTTPDSTPSTTTSTAAATVSATATSEPVEPARFPANTPVFLGGHGFGANIAISCAMAEPKRYAGLLLFAPDLHTDASILAAVDAAAAAAAVTAAKTGLPPPPNPAPSSVTGISRSSLWRASTLRSLITAVSHILPKLRVLPLEPEKYSRNLAVADMIRADRLFVNRRFAAHTTAECDRLKHSVLSRLDTLQTSFLVQAGLCDLVCHPAGTKELMEKSSGVPANLKGWIQHNRGWHDLLHEPEAEEIVQHCADYMDERVRLRFLASTIE